MSRKERISAASKRDARRLNLTDGNGRALTDVEGVAEMLFVSSRHVRRMADAGRMPPPIRLGGSLRWPIRLIEDWIADGCPNCKGRR